MPKKKKKVWSHLSTSHNNNKTWNITYWPSYDYSSKNPPKLHSSVHIQLWFYGFYASFPLCTRASGRERRVGKDSGSTSPPLLVVTGPTCHVSSRSSKAAKATAQPFWWLGQRNCFPPLLIKVPSGAANISALKATHWVAGINSQALCCYQSQVLFFQAVTHKELCLKSH